MSVCAIVFGEEHAGLSEMFFWRQTG